MIRKKERKKGAKEEVSFPSLQSILNTQDKIFRRKIKWRRLEVWMVESSSFHMEIFGQSQSGRRFLLLCSWKEKWGKGKRRWPHSPLEPHDPFPMWHIPEPWKGEGRGTERVGLGAGRWFNSQPCTASSCLPTRKPAVSQKKGRGQIWMYPQAFLVVYGIFQTPMQGLFLTKKT